MHNYIPTPNRNPTRPLIFPQGYLVLADDVLLLSNNPDAVTHFFSQLRSLVKSPVDDTYGSCYTALVERIPLR